MSKRPKHFSISTDLSKKLRFETNSILDLTLGPYVITDRICQLLDELSLYISGSFPIMVIGPSCSGKSSLIEAFASLKGQELVRLNVGEQSEPKSLLGSYISDPENPGHFRWSSGIFVEAMLQGKWIVLEDLNFASSEYIAILRPILETRQILTNGAIVKAQENFRLFATTTSKLSPSLEHRFMPIEVPEINKDEIKMILNCQFPSLSPVLSLLLDLYKHMESFQELSGFVTLRNLVKFCRRISCTALITDTSLNLESRKMMLLDLSDCFFGGVPFESRKNLLTKIKDLLCLSEDDILSEIASRAPLIELSDDCCKVGRIAPSKLSNFCKPFELAPTKTSLQVLEKVAVAANFCEPVLLVGETGTGKTTIVQNLASLVGQHKLIVLNLSQQSEASDLLGGFRPLSLSVSARVVVDKFENLFSRTFSRTKNTQYLGEVVMAFQKKNFERLFKLFLQVLDQAKRKESLIQEWTSFENDVNRLYSQFRAGPNQAFFAFIEGTLVKAMENGYWILFDEINLATNETLEILSGILQSPSSSLFLGERGDRKPIFRHPNFRIFACMNPATDFSKRNLPPLIRSKFTEIYVDETDIFEDDLRMIVDHNLKGLRGVTPILRENIVSIYYSWKRSVKDHEMVDGSRKMPLLNLRTLTRALRFARNTDIVYGLQRALYEGLHMSFITMLDEGSSTQASRMLLECLGLITAPPAKLSQNVINNFTKDPSTQIDNYILPVGPLNPKLDAELNGKFVLTPSVCRNVSKLARAIMARSYPILLEGPTSAGKTSVIEYLALRTGHRFVRINNHEHTDIQEYIGAYQPDEDGRLCFKEGLLVEALRRGHWLVLDELNLAPSDVLEALNRLLDDNRELYVPELGEVIKPHPSFLLFATQNPAGLYGGRKILSKAFRSRFLELQFSDLPIDEVEEIICKRCLIAPSHAKKISKVYSELQKRRFGGNLFAGSHSLVTLRDLFRWASRQMVTIEDLAANGYMVLAERLRSEDEKRFVKDTLQTILKVNIDLDSIYNSAPLGLKLTTWTKPMIRLYSLVYKAILNKEPVLLVGETGCGKTTVCQVLSKALERQLVIVNCQQNTETSDFLGSLRPNRSEKPGNGLFVWQDGPLVQCMRQGNMLLVDEISLAEDSVLERLNSVLEIGRTLTLAESIDGEEIIAHENFIFLATMNPGGDYGKKELSPALRNRFTEIWVPSIGNDQDLLLILKERLGGTELAEKMVVFINWWRQRVFSCSALKRWPFSIRDILTWVSYFDVLGTSPWVIVNSAASIFIDPVKSIAQSNSLQNDVKLFIDDCVSKLYELFSANVNVHFGESVQFAGGKFGIDPFLISAKEVAKPSEYFFDSPTTRAGLWRVLRAMTTGKPILLEGSPGVGKTSLIDAIAKSSGNKLVRINLSEQTDLVDLFGADMPCEGKFTWIDGPFLRALKLGHWILLDELNLASQSVLEGLNACLDHRGEVYISELDRTFKCSPDTRIFGAQNPVQQGGGRKGLPKSFLNRFMTVWMDPLEFEDMVCILSNKLVDYSNDIIQKAVHFTQALDKAVVKERLYAIKGSPWEFNLRDLLRWSTLLKSYPDASPGYLLSVIFVNRMRSSEDKLHVSNLIEQYFPGSVQVKNYYTYQHFLRVGQLDIDISNSYPIDLELLPSQISALEGLIACQQHNWLGIIYGEQGKSSTIRLIAALAGKKLTEMSLSLDSDTSELLGSFEQVSTEEELVSVAKKASHILGREVQVGELSTIFSSELSTSDLKATFSSLIGAEMSFKWKDGPLIRAMLNGDWLVLDQANQCNPSVLDRLNSLFEPNGILTLTESADIEPRVIIPHKDFRVFMICNGTGELSRAMRNRGLEIVIDGKSNILEDLSVIRASAKVGNSVACRFTNGNANWHDLGRIGKILSTRKEDLENFTSQPMECDNLPKHIMFWLNADGIDVFGRGPSSYQQQVVDWCLNHLPITQNVRSICTQIAHFSKLDFAIFDKNCKLVKNNAVILDGNHFVGIELLPLEGHWKKFWKTMLREIYELHTAHHKLVELLTSLSTFQSTLYEASSIAAVIETGNFELMRSRNLHATTLDIFGELIKVVRYLEFWDCMGSATNQAKFKLSLCNFNAPLRITDSLKDTILSLRSFLNTMPLSKLQELPLIRKDILNLATNIPAVKNKFDNILPRVIQAESELTFHLETLCGLEPIPKTDLVKIGLRQIRCLIRLFSSDPVFYYHRKRSLIEGILSINQELLDIQTTIRVQLFGDDSIPQPLKTILDLLFLKLQSLKNIVYQTDRWKLYQDIESLVNDGSILSENGPIGKWKIGLESEHLKKSLLVIRQRFASSGNLDLLLPVMHAIDLIVLGMQLHLNNSLQGTHLFITENSELKSSLLLQNVNFETNPSVVSGFKNYCQFRLLEKSLDSQLVPINAEKDLLCAILKKIDDLFKKLQEDSDTADNLLGLDNEDVIEEKIAAKLFSGGSRTPMTNFVTMVRNFQNIVSNSVALDFDKAFHDIIFEMEEYTVRSLVELSYREIKPNQKVKVNIYREHVLQESIDSLRAVFELQKRVLELLSEYPEHDVLQTLLLQCERFADLPADSTIMTLLHSIEVIVQKSQVWEKVADRAHSLSSELKILTLLILKWRKMELSGWKSILDSVDEEFQESVAPRLLWVCQVISHEYSSNDCSELVKLLDSFLLSSPMGELEYRINLLSESLNYPFITSSARRIIIQVLSYFKILSHSLSAHISNHRKQISQDLKASLVTITWNEKSYWNLRQITEKSHRAIAKQVRKYRELMDQPVSIVLAKSNLNGFNLPSDAEKQNLLEIFSWKAPKSLPNTAIKCFNQFSEILKSIDVAFPITGLDNLTTSIISRVEELAKLNTKGAVQIKQKAFVELVRLYRSFGLKLAAPYTEEESSVATLLAKSSVYHGDEKIEQYLSRCLSNWQELRNPSLRIHEDIGIRQVEALRAVIFRSLELANLQRTLLGAINTLILTGQDLVSSLEVRKVDSSVPIDGSNINSVIRSVRISLLQVLQAKEMIKPHEHQDEIQSNLMKLECYYRDILSELPNSTSQYIWIPEPSYFKLNDIVQNIKTFIDKTAPDSISDIWNAVRSTITHIPDLISSTLDVDHGVQKDLQLLSQQIDIQGIIGVSRSEVDGFGFAPEYLLSLTKTTDSLRLDQVMENFNDILRRAIRSGKLSGDFISIARVTFNGLSAIFRRFEYHHRSLLKLSFVTSSIAKRLFSQGFCRPKESLEEESKEMDNDGKVEEGTGMAEGEGSKNVSAELEFEEQITDLLNDEKEEENTDNQDPKMEEERVEMNEDFNAETNSVDSNEEDDKDDDQEKNDMSDIDDQMGETGQEGELQELGDGWENENDSEDKPELDKESPEEELLEYSPEGLPEYDESLDAVAEDDSKDRSSGEELAGSENEEGSVSDEASDDNEVNEEDLDMEVDGEQVEDEMGSDDDDGQDAMEKLEADDNDNDEIQEEEAEGIAEADAPENEPQLQDDQKGQQESTDQDTGNGDSSFNNIDQSSGSTNSQNVQLQADKFGNSKETVKAKNSSAKSDKGAGRPDSSQTMDQAIENLQCSIHEILSASPDSDKEILDSSETIKDQLFEENDSSNQFAIGTSKEHNDFNARDTSMDEVEESKEMECDAKKSNDNDEAIIEEKDLKASTAKNTYHRDNNNSADLTITKQENDLLLPEWDLIEASTHDLASDLCEQLRLVLEPTKSTKLRGDYRTGKRLNLRKIPAYIASNFRRDKIWLRRTKPSQRTYRIAISMDNSRSMKGVCVTAVESMATILQALNRLESGEISIIKFGNQTELIHPFEKHWSSDLGKDIIRKFTFNEEYTDVSGLLQFVNDSFQTTGNFADWQLNIILSDGICQNHEELSKLINAGLAKRIIHVFLILDSKVADIQNVQYLPNGGINMTQYLDTFPFQYYLLMKELRLLPSILAESIRQWFEAVTILE